MRVLTLFFLFLVGLTPVVASENNPECGQGRSQNTLVGPAPLTAQLHASAKNQGGESIFFSKGQFEKETFRYLGEVTVSSAKKWHIVFLTTIWGESCRSTPRLLIFNEDKIFVGQYSHFGPRNIIIDGDTLLFEDADPRYGNKVKFESSGPPQTAYIDGDNFKLYR